MRDSATHQILTDGGLTVANPIKQILGNIQPNWTGGWGNTVTYKRLSLSALLDIHNGGNLWSITNWFGDYAGVLKSSLKGREVDWNKPGYLVKGLDINSCGTGSHTTKNYNCVGGTANNTTVTSRTTTRTSSR
jgi:hypothetical protein